MSNVKGKGGGSDTPIIPTLVLCTSHRVNLSASFLNLCRQQTSWLSEMALEVDYQKKQQNSNALPIDFTTLKGPNLFKNRNQRP